MSFVVYELPKAQQDKQRIVDWLFIRSPKGASAWLTAYDKMVQRLVESADSLSKAIENDDLDLPVRQILFKTKHGRVYRAIYYIDGVSVYVLRIRGPGQAPINDEQAD